MYFKFATKATLFLIINVILFDNITAQCPLDFSVEKDISSCYSVLIHNNSIGNNLIYEWDFGHNDFYITNSTTPFSHKYFCNDRYTNHTIILKAYNLADTCSVPKPCAIIQKTIKPDTMFEPCILPTVCSIDVLSELTATSSYTSDCKYKKLTFNSLTSCGSKYAYDFGDGTKDTTALGETNINHLFPSIGIYNVTITSLDANNQPIIDSPHTISYTVTVSCFEDREIGNHAFNFPSAFSPNGDNINDAFCVQGDVNCLSKFYLKIFDRWGEKVFETNNPSICWDGKYKGKLLNIGSFIYHAQATFLDSTQVEKKGNVTMIK